MWRGVDRSPNDVRMDPPCGRIANRINHAAPAPLTPKEPLIAHHEPNQLLPSLVLLQNTVREIANESRDEGRRFYVAVYISIAWVDTGCSSAYPDFGFCAGLSGIRTKLFGMVPQVGKQALLLLLAPLSVRVLCSHFIISNGVREVFRYPFIH